MPGALFATIHGGLTGTGSQKAYVLSKPLAAMVGSAEVRISSHKFGRFFDAEKKL